MEVTERSIRYQLRSVGGFARPAKQRDLSVIVVGTGNNWLCLNSMLLMPKPFNESSIGGPSFARSPSTT
jgi:hypothetical protein